MKIFSTKIYKENIEPLLKDTLNLGDEEEDDSEKYDGELEGMQPTFLQHGFLPKSYMVWLRLMVTHFDATNTVVQAIYKLQLDTVSVTILFASKTNETLLP